MRTDIATLSEARDLIAFAARKLNPTERQAVAGFMREETQAATAARLGITDGGVFMAKITGFRKIRTELMRMGIRRTEDLLALERKPVAQETGCRGRLLHMRGNR